MAPQGLPLPHSDLHGSPRRSTTPAPAVSIDLSKGPVVLNRHHRGRDGRRPPTPTRPAATTAAPMTYRIGLAERRLSTSTVIPRSALPGSDDCTDGDLVIAVDEFSATPLSRDLPGGGLDDPLAKGDFTLAVSLTPALCPTMTPVTTRWSSSSATSGDTPARPLRARSVRQLLRRRDRPDVVYVQRRTGQIVDIHVESDEFVPSSSSTRTRRRARRSL